jgi:predicted nucleotide-binding protein (sugar kinase/HSP70/actin superfamily)
MALSLYEQLPFWESLFSALRFQVVLSDESSRELYFSGQSTIASDTVCYPAKLMHGHIASLLKKNVDFIFYPAESYNFDEKKGNNHFNCPVVAYYSELLNGNVPELKKKPLLNPYLDISQEKSVYEALKKPLSSYGVSHGELKQAIEGAYQAMAVYRQRLIARGNEIIAAARDKHLPIVVLAGRPYHIDPEINHAIPALLTSLGFALVSEDVVASYSHEKLPVDVLNQWTYHARLYQAATYVTRQKDMELVQLVSFGCGLDAITTDEVRRILEGGNKLYTAIKIDEISNLGAARIRLRSLLAAMEEKA